MTKPALHTADWTLVHETGARVEIGQKVISFRGETWWLAHGTPPACEGKGGYVYVTRRKKDIADVWSRVQLYPSVFDLKWVRP